MMKTAHNPAFQERPERVNAGSMNLAAHILAGTVSDRLMIVVFVKQTIAGVLIGRYERHVIRDRRTNETIKSEGVGILNDLCDDHSLAGDSADHGNLAGSPWVAYALRAVFVFPLPADKGFINFDFASKRRDIIALHRGSPAHAHIPACVIVRAGVFPKDHPMHLQGADSLFGDQHEITDLEPEFERDFSILKNGFRNHGETIAVAPAAIFALTEPVKRPRLESVNLFAVTARATNAARPPHVGKKLSASLFGRELGIEGINCFHGSENSRKGDGCQ